MTDEVLIDGHGHQGDIIYVVKYHAMLLPHLKEFADALYEYKYTGLKESMSFFCPRNVELPKVVLDLLSPALKVTHFDTL